MTTRFDAPPKVTLDEWLAMFDDPPEGEAARHQGPGPHASGSPQSIHGAGKGSEILGIAKAGGASVQPLTGRRPTSGYMVARLPVYGTIVPAGEFFANGEVAMRRFVVEREAQFRGDPDAFVGVWWDKRHREFALDVSMNVQDEGAARILGQLWDQQAIWDVVGQREIPTGGTGGRSGAALGRDPAARRLLGYDGAGAARLVPDRGRRDQGDGGGGLDLHARHPGGPNHWSQKVHGNRYGKGGKVYWERGTGTEADPYTTNDVNGAAVALVEGKHVRLESPDEVGTFLTKLKGEIDQRRATGDKRSIDLCKVSVPDTNLFCTKNVGVERIRMPQLRVDAKDIAPGSLADQMVKAGTLPVSSHGEVDLGPMFVHWMQGNGTPVTERIVDASHLKASQNQLEAGKVLAIAETGRVRPEIFSGNVIYVTKDNYVIDGHHRWAAAVADEYIEGQPMPMKVHSLDKEIVDTLTIANLWTYHMGLRGEAGISSGQRARRRPEGGCCG